MGDKYWYLLIEELNFDVIVLNDENGIYARNSSETRPLNQYISWLNELASRFIGECGRNIDEAKKVPEEFDRLLYKLNHSFQRQFGINFPDYAIPYPLLYGNLKIPSLNMSSDPLISVVKAKIDAFDLAISFLKTKLNEQTVTHRIKKFTETDSKTTGFKLKPRPRIATIKEVFIHLYSNEFITKSKNSNSLNQFFNGEIPRERINWIKDLAELKYFIDVIIKDKVLLEEPGQQWKYMQDIFTCQGEELKMNWYKTHNKLKSPQKRQAIEELVLMLHSLI